MATDLSGKVEIKGSLGRVIRGRPLSSIGPKDGRRSRDRPSFRGTLESLEITNLEAAWLDGSVKGPLKISWVEGISVQGKLQARKLNPSTLNPEWKGELNLDLEGKFLSPPARRTRGLIQGGPSGESPFRKGFQRGPGRQLAGKSPEHDPASLARAGLRSPGERDSAGEAFPGSRRSRIFRRLSPKPRVKSRRPAGSATKRIA